MRKIYSKVRKYFNSDLDIFISHSSKDQEIVKALIEVIEKTIGKGFKIRCTSVLDYKIEPGKNFENQIKEDILNAKLVIALLSKDSLASGHVQNEIGGAWILNKSWVLLHYEDDIGDQFKSFVKNYELTPIYNEENLMHLCKYLSKTFNNKDIECHIDEEIIENLFTKIENKFSKNDFKPFKNNTSILHQTYNYMYYRDYNEAYNLLKKINGCKEVYNLLKDIHLIKNVSSKFRMSKQEEDIERLKLLSVFRSIITKRKEYKILVEKINNKNI